MIPLSPISWLIGSQRSNYTASIKSPSMFLLVPRIIYRSLHHKIPIATMPSFFPPGTQTAKCTQLIPLYRYSPVQHRLACYRWWCVRVFRRRFWSLALNFRPLLLRSLGPLRSNTAHLLSFLASRSHAFLQLGGVAPTVSPDPCSRCLS